ncbi:MAG: hypothetical protein J1E39_03230 [Eubacterium sp.]|nr:hypothetical protein [Eubacterium sp.]
MNYRELFSSINCQCIIIFEDDFKQNKYKKESALYDITRLHLEDRKLYLSDINSVSPDLAVKLQRYLEAFDKCFDAIGSWRDNVTFGDITGAFSLVNAFDPALKDEIEQLYSDIEGEALPDAYKLGAKYGIGVTHPSQFDVLFDDYVLFDSRTKPIRIYTDFSASTQSLFKTDIDKATNNQSVVCIIDNQLDDAKRADEIVKVIEEACTSERKNIVGSIFSSQDAFEVISDKVYFEYTSKDSIDNLETSIAKSAYNYFLSELKNETLVGLDGAFESAKKNKGIAFYLSRKARNEGESEYQIINDWIRLLSTASNKNSETIKHLIALSRVINSLEDSDDVPDVSLQKLNTLEAFDYTINEYYLPVAAGDIFTDDNGHWYVLIGQDCDMARRPNKSPRNALAELLPATLLKQSQFSKWANNLKTASIYNFRKSLTDESEILQVDYQHREYIAHEIINLCAFNSDGQCKITLSQGLDNIQYKLLPNYMVEYHKRLQQFFSSIKVLRGQAEEAFNLITSNDYTPRLISFNDFEMDSDTPTFNLRRVCRLTHSYVFYLYKLYLEYRGRQPFQTINLIRQEETILPVVFNRNLEKDLFACIQCVPNPDKNNRKDWCWVIDKKEIERITETLGIEISSLADGELIIDSEEKELSLSNGKKLKIQKAKNTVNLFVV